MTNNIAFWLEQNRKRLWFERRLAAPILRELNRFVLSARVNTRLGVRNVSDLEIFRHKENIFKILGKSYGQIIPAFGKTATINGKNSKHFVDFETKSDDLFQVLVLKYLYTEGLLSAKNISETSAKSIRNALSRPEVLSGEITAVESLESLAILNASRAILIGRTEIIAASNYGSIESVRSTSEDLGLEPTKEWIANSDSRVRDTHLAMNSVEPIPINEKFFVGGYEMDRPGDPAGGAANVINCRCVLGYAVVD